MSSSDKVVSERFRFVYAVSNSASAATYAFNVVDLTCANLGLRVSSIAASYEFFRLCSMHIYGFGDQGTALYDTSGLTKQGQTLAVFGIAFDSESSQLTSSPTSFNDVTQYSHSIAGNIRSRLNLSIGAKDLWKARPMKWSQTGSTGTPPKGESSAGMVVVWNYNSQSTNNAGTTYAIAEGVIQFKGRVSPGLSKKTMVSDRPIFKYYVSGAGVIAPNVIGSGLDTGLDCVTEEELKDLVEEASVSSHDLNLRGAQQSRTMLQHPRDSAATVRVAESSADPRQSFIVVRNKAP